MPRIRTIKPEFWTDEKIIGLDFCARLLFVGMWNFADDEGYLPNEPTRLRLQILPADDIDIDAILAELIDCGLVQVVSLNGDRTALWIPHFGDHQRISKPTKSRISPERSEIPATPPKSPRGKGKGKGKEGKGKGMEWNGNKRREIPAEIRGGDISQENEPTTKPKRGRRPSVTVDDVTFADGMDSPAVRSALDDWLAHRRAIRKGYRSAESVDQLLTKWQPRGPTEFVDAVSHSIANEYQGLFSETNGTNRPGKNRFGPGQIFTPGAGADDPEFGKM